MTILPLRTARLTLRVMHPEDAATLASYRDDVEVARFQDWAMPYGIADAQRLLAPQAGLDDLDPTGWTQVAVEHDGRVVGDVAVELDPAAPRAAIGYTLAPDWHHRGLALEAVGAVVDALFQRSAVRRIEASLDPDNVASMRVVETLGFCFEGVARQAALVRGAWVDDARFAILREDRAAWCARNRSRPQRVELVELDDETAGPFARLATHRFQERFVAPMDASWRHALLPEIVDGARVVPWFRGITADGVPAGFVMLAAATSAHPDPYLWRLLVDRWHQRRGIGERAVATIVDLLRRDGRRRLLTSWVDGPGSPAAFYARLGFRRTGRLVEGEIEGVLEL